MEFFFEVFVALLLKSSCLVNFTLFCGALYRTLLPVCTADQIVSFEAASWVTIIQDLSG